MEIICVHPGLKKNEYELVSNDFSELARLSKSLIDIFIGKFNAKEVLARLQESLQEYCDEKGLFKCELKVIRAAASELQLHTNEDADPLNLFVMRNPADAKDIHLICTGLEDVDEICGAEWLFRIRCRNANEIKNKVARMFVSYYEVNEFGCLCWVDAGFNTIVREVICLIKEENMKLIKNALNTYHYGDKWK